MAEIVRQELPRKSEGSWRGGTWFVFRDGESYIRLWGSSVSGKERIYVDDTEVISYTNLKTSSRIAFEHNETPYEILVAVPKDIEGLEEPGLSCSLYKDGSFVQRQLCVYRLSPNQRSYAFGVIVCGFVGMFSAMEPKAIVLDWPESFVWPQNIPELSLKAFFAMTGLVGEHVVWGPVWLFVLGCLWGLLIFRKSKHVFFLADESTAK